MTKRGVLLVALIALAVVWLSGRAGKISILEEEETAITNNPHPNPLPIQGEGEDEEVIKPDTSPYEGEVGPANAGTGEVKSAATETFLVSHVIDGDTIKLEDGKTVRYIGIDAPEIHHPKKPKQCFAEQATEKNQELVEGKRVRLEKDVSDKDKYGRLLRYVYVDSQFINDTLVRQGYAHAYPFPPDVTFRDQFRIAQNEARTAKKGIWGICG